MRIDSLLKTLCLVKTRSLARKGRCLPNICKPVAELPLPLPGAARMPLLTSKVAVAIVIAMERSMICSPVCGDAFVNGGCSSTGCRAVHHGALFAAQ